VLVNEDLQIQLESAGKNKTLLVVMQRSEQSLASALSPVLARASLAEEAPSTTAITTSRKATLDILADLF
jgi:hypothetical protein